MKGLSLILFLVSIGCKGPSTTVLEAKLKQSAANICECHGGVEATILLDGYLSMRAKCSDGYNRVVFVGLSKKSCVLN